MIYDITKPTAPAMPNLGKGLELPKLLFSQVSKDMQEAIAPLIFDSLASHISVQNLCILTLLGRKYVA